jgi:succinoglycan biosynthesis transport protein ExoP
MLDRNSGAPVVETPDGMDYPSVSVHAKAGFGLGSLRRHAAILGLSVFVFVGIGLAFVALRPATYTASTLLLVYNRQISSGQDAVVLPGSADIPLVQNQIEMLQSRNVLMRVIDGLALDRELEYAETGWSVGDLLKPLWPWQGAGDRTKDQRRVLLLEQLRRKLTGRRVGTSHVVSVSFKARDPQKAARIVNKIARTYLQELARAWDVGAARSPAIRELYQSLGPSAYVVSEAEPPTRSDGPAPYLILIAAAVVGALLGAAAALLVDFLDHTFRNADQVETVVGLPCLAVIPRIEGTRARSRRKEPALIGTAPSGLNCIDIQDRSLPYVRALRRLAAAMQDPSLPELRSIGVIAAVPGEGATTIAIGLAQSLAAAGKRLLVIDAVPENPSASSWWNNDKDSGSAGSRSARSSGSGENVFDVKSRVNVIPMERTSDVDPYSVCPNALDDCVKKALNEYDTVIIDLPSLASGPDALAVARTVDGFLLVVRWGETDSVLIRQAIQSAGEAQRKFIGTVLNAADEGALRKFGIVPSAEDVTAKRPADCTPRREHANPQDGGRP